MPTATTSVSIPLPNDMPSFVDFVRKVLQEIMDKHIDLIPSSLQQVANAAWTDLVNSGAFDDLRARANTKANSGALDAAGLTGPQGKFKLKAVAWGFGRLAAGWFADPLRKLLEIVDDILKSLIDALGAGSAIEEFKSILEKLLGESDEALAG